MSIDQIQRPKFYQNQYLGPEDLTAAVEYARTQNARHALGAHTWGIAMGLQLTEKESSSGGGKQDVYIQPGFAWDGVGRPIVVLTPFKISEEYFKSYIFNAAIDGGTPEGRLIEVWLSYDESATGAPLPGFRVCDPEDQYSRIRETFRVEIGQRPNHSDQHDPISVAGYSVDAQDTLQKLDPQTPQIEVFDESIPYQDFPESLKKFRWLIPLGLVRWKPNSNPNQPGNFIKREKDDLEKSNSLRRYIGVVAGAVQAAEKNIRMRDRTKDYSKALSDDLVWVEGSLRVEGDAKLFGGNLDFRDPLGNTNNTPLRIQRIENNGQGGKDLQVVIGQNKDGKNRLEVGPVDATNELLERFVIRDDGKVGIGTATPVTKLEIVGDWDQEEGALRLTGDKPTLRFTGGAISGNESWILQVGSNGPGNLEISRRTGPTVWKPLMSFTPSGRVGIGTTAPQATLHVRRSGILPPFGVDVAIAKEDLELDSLGSFRIGTNNVERLRITSAGRVGIGTQNPTEMLDVRGNIRLGTNGDLFAMGALLNLRVIVGRVSKNGTVIGTSTGFAASRTNDGEYTVTFSSSFTSNPIVFVSPVDSVNNDNLLTIRNISSAGFDVRAMDVTDDDEPVPEDTGFTFIALGSP